jgi:hypothetical protein
MVRSGTRTAKALLVAMQRRKNTERRRRNRALERVRTQEVTQSAAASQSNSDCLDAFLVNRAATEAAKELALALHSLTNSGGLDYQKALFQKLLEQPILQNLLPEYVVHRKELESCRVVCDGLHDAWSGLKFGFGRDKKLARNVIEAAVISLQDERCFQAAATAIGMNRRTLRRAKERRSLLNTRVDGELWARLYRKKKKDALPQAVVDIVVNWWEEETRVSPCKKDVRRKRVGVRQFVSHATH